MEILVNQSTKVEQSPKAFRVKPKVIPDASIMEIMAMVDGVAVNLKEKVMAVELPRAVGTGLVQDVTLYDGANTVSLSVWDSNVNKFEVLKTYQFRMLYTRSYQGVRSVTLTRRSEYEVVDDVMIENVETEDEMDTIKDAQIVGVTKFNIHITCINCNSKLFIVGRIVIAFDALLVMCCR